MGGGDGGGEDSVEGGDDIVTICNMSIVTPWLTLHYQYYHLIPVQKYYDYRFIVDLSA